MKKLILIFLLLATSLQAQWFVPNPKGLLRLNNTWTGTQTYQYILPDGTRLYNLGSPSAYWLNFYTQNIYTDTVKTDITLSRDVVMDSTLIVRELNGVINLKKYGAVGDGITNDSASFVSALAYASVNNKTLFIPQGTYLTGTLTLPDSVKILGDDNAIIRFIDGRLGSMITTGNNNTISNLTIEGGLSVAPTGNDGRDGILVSFKNYVVIRNVNVFGFGRYGIRVAYSGYNTTERRGTVITSINAQRNYYGVALDTRAEFTQISNSSFSLNRFGLYVNSGNNMISGCIFTTNYDGMQLTTGDNDAHGILSGCIFAHNVNYGLNGTSFRNGELINSNTFYGQSRLYQTMSTVFSNNIIGGQITFQSNGIGSAINNTIVDGGSFTITTDSTLFSNNIHYLSINRVITDSSTYSNVNNSGNSGLPTKRWLNTYSSSSNLGIDSTGATEDSVYIGRHTLLVNCGASDSNVVWLSDYNVTEGQEYKVKKIDANATNVIVKSKTGFTIDGAISKIWNTQYQTYTFVYRNKTWYIL